MGIERVYDTATHPGLSIKVPMSETGQIATVRDVNIAVGDVFGP